MFLIRKSSCFPLQCSYLAANRSNIFALFPSPHFLTSLHLFNSNAEHSSPDSPFIVDYLIASVGLSLEEAIKASKLVAHIKSPSNPDSVLQFFKQNGFTGDDIKRIILRHPRLLRSNVDSTLKPKIEGLIKLGFSETDIVRMITASPLTLNCMCYKNMLPRVEFLRGFLGSDKNVVKALLTDTSLVYRNLDKGLKPNLTFLRECQIPDDRIVSLMTRFRHPIGRPLSYLKDVAKRVEEFGVPRGSKMFFYVFSHFAGCNTDVVNTKIKWLGQLGFSEADILLAIKKFPPIIGLSKKNLQETVAFLVNEAGCDLSYVINHPSLLGLSLNRRLIPRNYVRQLLKVQGYLKKKLDIYRYFTLSEVKFIEIYVLPYEEMIPNLLNDYISMRAIKS